ncbi:ATPase subunit 9 [Perkinsela sp. CCAP 1560/4]|nr:ATPase subunit 9 [Perkinsela sp. CCAP 1560/4]|eukprot:KNH04058.1 ATPase subunit 9 [Perkinsela sp. CCAP 1560/4]
MIRRFSLIVPRDINRQVRASNAMVPLATCIHKPLDSIRHASSVTVTIQGLHYVGAGLAAIALAGVGIGIGSVFGSLLLACSRQPNMAKQLFNYAVLGFALTEAIGLFALMLAFLMLFS